jgi:hypothetical protein
MGQKKIYIVCRWGNDEEGSDGKDTLFIIAAKSHLVAAAIADDKLKGLPHKQIAPRSNWICRLGTTEPDAHFNGILKGPFYDIAAVEGGTTYWIRENWQQRWHKKMFES